MQNLGQYTNGSNLTLQFLPGNHTLSVNLTITNMYQLEIFGSVEDTRIVCGANVGLTFRNISEMKIDGLTFVSCARPHVAQIGRGSSSSTLSSTYYGLYIRSIQKTEIIDCIFQDSYGSALWIVDSHIFFIKNNNFLRNCRLCSNGGCPYWNTHICEGGGVFAERSNVSFTGSNSFISNSAYSGGGVLARDHSNVDISGNTTFIGNSATFGGGIRIKSNSNVNIDGNGTFNGNVAIATGGGVYAQSSCSVNISGNTIFHGNSANWDMVDQFMQHTVVVWTSGGTPLSVAILQ